MEREIKTAGKPPIVLNYDSLVTLKENIVSGNLQMHGPMITAYASVAKALNGKIPCHVVSFNELLPTLLGSWDEADSQFKQLLLVYRIIHDLSWREASDSEKKALYNNAADILLSIREFAMMGISSDKIPADTKLLTLFQKIYAQFSNTNNPEYYKHSNLDALSTHKAMWESNLPKTLVNIFPMFYEAKAVYLQGFCYITPRQALFIQALVHAGYQVYFLNHHSESNDMAFEIWDKNMHFKGLETKNIVKQFSTQGERGENNVLKVPASDKVSFTSFTDIFSFVNYIKGQQRPTNIFCPLCKSTENMIDTFFADKPTKDRLLSYPLGQYIFNLFSMWKNGSHITINAMRECIAAGWADGCEPHCVESFDALSMFFRGCDELGEWIQRIDDLDGRLTQKWPYKDEHIKYIYLRSHQAQSMALLKCMRNILEDYDALFSKKKTVDALFALKDIIESRVQNKNDDVPNSVVARIFLKRLKNISEDFIITDINSLTKSIQFFLGGNGREYSDPDGEFLHELNNKDSNLEFNTISEAETAQLELEKPAIVAFCDADHMPGGTQKYPWPLTKDIMELIKSKISDDNIALLIDDFIFYRESFRLANRYRFYLANMIPNVTFTWVKFNGEKEVLPTPYFMLLKYSGVNVNYNENPLPVQCSIMSNRSYCFYDMPTIGAGKFYSDNLNLDKKFTSLGFSCAYKYYYGYKNDYGYKNGFHMDYTTPMLLSHYISALIYQVRRDNNDRSSKQIINNVLDFFPGLLASERATCEKFAPYDYQNFFRLDVLHNADIQKYENKLDCCKYCQHKDYCLKRINLRREEKE